MNFNKRAVRIASMSLTAGIILGSSVINVSAAPLAGITGYTVAVQTGQDTTGLTGDSETTEATPATVLGVSTGTATQSGVSSLLAQIVVESEEVVKAAEAETEEQAIIEEEQAAVSASDDPVYDGIAVANVSDYVYIRSEASAESDYVGKLYAKSAAVINGEEGDWYLISSGDVVGYINKEYLIVGDEEAVKEASRRVATVTTETLYVRSEPSTDSSIMGMVPLTDDLTVTDESIKSSGWVKVRVEEGEGYVSTEFVDLWTEFVVAESREAEEARLEKEEQERQAARASAEAAVANSSSSSNSGYTESYAAPSGSNGYAVVSYAAQFLGNPYVYGGSSLTNGTDCSGYVMSVYRAFGVSLPHSSAAMRSVGYGVSDMQPGDIVCYSGHVGIYAGNGQILNASTPSTGIIYTNVYYDTILAVRRIF